MAGNNQQKCPKCGSRMVTVRGRWTCLLCSTEKRTIPESHKFYEVNREEITADLRRLGRDATSRKWKITAGSFSKLRRRWGVAKPRARRTPAAVPADNHVPGLPAWSDSWPEAVQLKWLEILEGRLK